jgi:hypothetical protein
MVEITGYTEFATREVLSKTYETQIFTDKEIRDTNAHNSSIVDCCIYNLVTFFVINDLNQSVTVQVKGNRINSVTGALDVGSTFTVAASDSGAKAIAALVDGVLPYMFAEITAGVAPGSGDLSCYVEKKYIE